MSINEIKSFLFSKKHKNQGVIMMYVHADYKTPKESIKKKKRTDLKHFQFTR